MTEKFRRKIKIELNNEVRNIFVEDNCLEKKVLFEYYPTGSTLTYKIDNEIYLLHADDEIIYLAADIEHYQLNLPEVKPPTVERSDVSKRKTFQNMMSEIYNDDKFSKKGSGEKICNKRQKSKESKKQTVKQHLKRVVVLGWKHRQDFNSKYMFMGTAIGRKIKIELNGNENYSLDELLVLFKKEYVNDANRHFFDKSYVAIGTGEGEIFTKFVNNDGEPCNVWDFTRGLRNQSHILNLFLLTTNLTEKNPEITQKGSVNSRPSLPPRNLSSFESGPDFQIEQVSKITHKETEKVFSISVSVTAENRKNPQIDLTESCAPKRARSPVNLQLPPSVAPVYDLLHLNTGDIRFRQSAYDNGRNSQMFQLQSASNLTSKSFEFQNKEPSPPSDFQKTEPSPPFSLLTNQKVVSPNEESKFKKPLENKCMNDKVNALNLAVKSIQEKDLEFTNVILGQGGQGIVTKAIYLDTEVAVKTIPLTKTIKKEILREVKLLDTIRHQSIIAIMAVCPSPKKFYIVMEYFESDSLYDILFDSENDVDMNDNCKINVATQICQAVSYLHRQSPAIVHRDIKPSNILVNKHFVTKLCDLGLGQSNIFQKTLMSSNVGSLRGTIMYMAPEVLLHNMQANEKSDIWSVGCSLFELFTEEHTWGFQTFVSIMKYLQVERKPNLENVPKKIQDVLKACFNYDQAKRPTASTILKAIKA